MRCTLLGHRYSRPHDADAEHEDSKDTFQHDVSLLRDASPLRGTICRLPSSGRLGTPTQCKGNTLAARQQEASFFAEHRPELARSGNVFNIEPPADERNVGRQNLERWMARR